MAKQTYSEKLRDPRWQKLRLQIMERDLFTCRYCFDQSSTLNVHHEKYTAKEPWDEPEDHLVTVCEHCHLVVEKFKKTHSIQKLVKIQASNGFIYWISMGDTVKIVMLHSSEKLIQPITEVNRPILNTINQLIA